MAKPPFKLEVEGGPELRRALKALGADLKNLSALNRKVAGIVAPVARANAPRGESGKLSASLRPSGTRTRGRVQSNLIYAPPIHYGWPARGIAPNRFGDRALNYTAGEVTSTYERGIAQLCRKAES